MLPYAEHLPALLPQFAMIAGVPETVRLDFLLPFLGELQPPDREAPAMPEIAIDEYRNAA